MGRRTVSSSVFSNVSKSLKSPQLKTSKIRFSPLAATKKVDTEALKGVEKKQEETIQSANTLDETNRILVEIQKQLALDFANRIAERKQRIEASKKVQRKQKLKEKEDFVESGKKPGILSKSFQKISAPIKGLFDRLLEFFGLVGGGILLNNAWKWLSDKENREKFLNVLKFLGDHWKWITGIIIGVKLLGPIKKLLSLLGSIKKLINIFRRKPPRINPKKPDPTSPDFCQQVLKCLNKGGPVINNIKKRLLEDQDFLSRVRTPLPILPPPSNTEGKGENNNTEETSETEGQQTQEEPTRIKPPVFNVQELMLKAPGTFTDEEKKFLDSQNLDFYKSGQTQDTVTDLSALVALFAAVKTAPVWGPALLTQAGRLKNLFVKPKVVPQTQQALQQSASRSLQQTTSRQQALMRSGSRNPGERVTSASRRLTRSQRDQRSVDRQIRNLENQPVPPGVERQITNRSLSESLRNSPAAEASKRVTNPLKRLRRNIGEGQTVEQRGNLTAEEAMKLFGRMTGKSMGGTIDGIGSPIVDSVPAMLAPGEEVIRTASANMFRPVLKDINDNAGRLYTDFEKATFLQERQIKLSELNNKSFGESAEKFDEMVEKLLRKQQVRKAKEIEDKITSMGGILQVLNRVGTGVNDQQTVRQHNDPSYPIGQVVGGNELEPMINNEPQQQYSDLLTLNVTAPKREPVKSIETYRVKQRTPNGSSGSPTIVNMPLPAQVMPDQGDPGPVIQSDGGEPPVITHMSVDHANPNIMEAFEDFGIFA